MESDLFHPRTGDRTWRGIHTGGSCARPGLLHRQLAPSTLRSVPRLACHLSESFLVEVVPPVDINEDSCSPFAPFHYPHEET